MAKAQKATKPAQKTTSRAKALRPGEGRMTKAAREEADALERKREQKRAASARWYAKHVKTKAAALPNAAPAKPAPAAVVVAASAMTLSKTDMIGGLKAALLVVTDEQQKLGLQYALQLAQKLAD